MYFDSSSINSGKVGSTNWTGRTIEVPCGLTSATLSIPTSLSSALTQSWDIPHANPYFDFDRFPTTEERCPVTYTFTPVAPSVASDFKAT